MVCLKLVATFAAAAAIVSAQVTFLSAPGQSTVPLKVLTSVDRASQAPGYIFVSPYLLGSSFVGPTIYKPGGQLVWSGQALTTLDVNNFHVVDYLGQTGNHFIFHQGSGFGHETGVNRIFNASYVQVGPDYGAVNGFAPPDDHENNVYNGANGYGIVQDVYQTVKRDLSAYGGPEQGYILSGCFQDVSLVNDTATFQWCSGKHVALDETFVYLSGSSNYSNNLAGDGTQDSPWDYFHINAVDKDANGDYLVSSRHCSAVYKIAGKNNAKPGSILWRLGGKLNDFKMQPPSFNFSAQHDCRWQSPPSKTNTTITIFDNGSDGFGQGLSSAPASSGMKISIDESTRTATLLRQYVQPDYLSAGSQGSMQILSNGNVFISWSSLPYLSEFTEAGELLYNAEMNNPEGFSTYDTYRGYKYPWVGTPSAPPSTFAYSQACNSTQKFLYASWNGDTETSYWQVQTSNQVNGPWTTRGRNYTKESYETVLGYRSKGFQKYARALAFDSQGHLLSTSSATAIFVPSADYASECSLKRCSQYFYYADYDDGASACSTA